MAMRIRKVQYAPVMRPLNRHPCTIVRKDFMFSPGQLELEAALDKQVKPARDGDIGVMGARVQYIIIIQLPYLRPDRVASRKQLLKKK